MINENENNENNEEQETEVENNSDEANKPSSEYVKELLKEKVSLDPETQSNAMRLLDDGKLRTR